MARIIELSSNNSPLKPSEDILTRINARITAKSELLTNEKVRRIPGFENLNDVEANEVVDTVRQLAKIFFDIACQKEPTCIDNQQVVHLNQQNKAA